MSRPAGTTPADSLPPTARAIALLVASTPGVYDAQPGVLHQLLEFSHRYTSQVLVDAQVYSEHAGRSGKIEMDDVTLAVQARVGWEFGGRVPKEYLLSLATQTNATPLPPMPEVFGVRLPPASDCLTAVDFDLLPNRPPPDVKLYDEEIEEIAESDSEEEGDYEEDEPSTTATGINQTFRGSTLQSEDTFMEDPGQPVGPISALTPSDVDMLATPVRALAQEEEEEDPLFGDEGDEPMDAAPASSPAGGVKRKLELDEDYD